MAPFCAKNDKIMHTIPWLLKNILLCICVGTCIYLVLFPFKVVNSIRYPEIEAATILKLKSDAG